MTVKINVKCGSKPKQLINYQAANDSMTQTEVVSVLFKHTLFFHHKVIGKLKP